MSYSTSNMVATHTEKYGVLPDHNDPLAWIQYQREFEVMAKADRILNCFYNTDP